MRATNRSGHRYVLAAGVLLALLAGLSLYAWQVQRAEWEVDVLQAVQQSRLPGLHELSVTLAIAGHGVPWMALIGSIAVVLLLAGNLRLVLMLVGVAVLQDLGALLKLLIERGRPPAGPVEVWGQLSSYSFPSGHTLGATLVFGFLFFAVEHCSLPVAARRAVQALCAAWIILMGVARMALGAHWPTDVLGAYLTGALLLLPVVYLLRRSVPPPAEHIVHESGSLTTS
jgi:undecaprenyl-diphosphatase